MSLSVADKDSESESEVMDEAEDEGLEGERYPLRNCELEREDWR